MTEWAVTMSHETSDRVFGHLVCDGTECGVFSLPKAQWEEFKTKLGINMAEMEMR